MAKYNFLCNFIGPYFWLILVRLAAAVVISAGHPG